MNNNNDKSTQQQQQKPTATNEPEKLMPKTLLELKEIQARGRKMAIKTKYVRKENTDPYPPAKEKSKEEIELEKTLKAKEIKAAEAQIVYSHSYYDDTSEYRHVVLPKNLLKYLPNGLLQPYQWIEVGVRQSPSWEHYMIYAPEPHILLFRRSKEYRQQRQAAKEAAEKENKDKTNEQDTTHISDIPPSSRTGLFRTKSLR